MTDFEKARALLYEFKGDSYLSGTGTLKDIGKVAATAGKKIALVRETFPGSDDFVDTIRKSLKHSDINLIKKIKGPAPNCPKEDLFRIAEQLKSAAPEVIVSFGGGSTIDAVKAADVLVTIGGNIDDYFGTGLVTKALDSHKKSLIPHVAIQTAASSAAHLTKYSNITDTSTGQKKLIVDDAIIPEYPVFDYEVTYNAPQSLTTDGALDGIAHCLEVLYGSVGKPFYDKMEDIAGIAIGLVVEYLPRVITDPNDEQAREAICLATDLGGYSIMIGGTNGGHLTSFSLVDILSHGRACAIMNPYYTVFFAPAIEQPLKAVGKIYDKAGLTDDNIESLTGRDLGIAVAKGMFELSRKVGFPICLKQVKGFTQQHIERALKAAKNPQLKMKLQNMPVSLNAEMVDEYMVPVLEAAKDGNLSIIKNV